MPYPKFNKLSDRLYWAYANLSMFFFALKEEKQEYDQQCFMIRAKMYKGFRTGEMKVKSMFIDQKMKLRTGNQCAYCGISEEEEEVNFALDHILPRIKGGKDIGDNLIIACRSCNSSKRDTDLLEWYDKNGLYADPWILRTYLKLVIQYCEDNNLMEKHKDELDYKTIPFNPDYLPLELPTPRELGLFDD